MKHPPTGRTPNSPPKKTKQERAFEKARWEEYARKCPSLIPVYTDFFRLSGNFYIDRNCAKCGGPNKILPKVSRRYFGKVERRLCELCKNKNIKDSAKRSAIRQKLKNSTEVKNSATHTTPKRRGYQEFFESLTSYFEETLRKKK